MPDPVANLKKTASNALTWEAPEFAMKQKSRRWYGVLFGGTIAVIVTMVLLQNYPAAVFFALAAFVVSLYSNKPPRMLVFGVDGRGVAVGDRLYAYEDLRSFWIFYEKGMRSELSLQSHKLIMPYIRLPLGKTNPVALHALLSRFLPEQKHADSAIDAFSRQIGF